MPGTHRLKYSEEVKALMAKFSTLEHPKSLENSQISVFSTLVNTPRVFRSSEHLDLCPCYTEVTNRH
jgi:hypothetical protein